MKTTKDHGRRCLDKHAARGGHVSFPSQYLGRLRTNSSTGECEIAIYYPRNQLCECIILPSRPLEL